MSIFQDVELGLEGYMITCEGHIIAKAVTQRFAFDLAVAVAKDSHRGKKLFVKEQFSGEVKGHVFVQ